MKISIPTHIKVLGLILSLMATMSCKKLIEIPPNPPNFIATEKMFADSLHVMGAVAGIYNNFGITGYGSALLNGGITLYTGLSGDELIASSASFGDDVSFYNNEVLPVNSANAFLWSDAYAALYQINACIEGISSSTAISSSLKKQLLAEIKVDRALYYFNLLNLFGPVPLVTSTNYKVTQSLPRAPIDAIYAQISQDLSEAKQGLSNQYPSAGRARPNLAVANALLARISLYRGLWKDAEDAATSVIGSGTYSMSNELNKVFLSGSSEAIWQLPANGLYNQTYEATTFVPTQGGGSVSNDIVPNYYLSASLVAAFEPGDLRMQQWTGLNTVNNGGTADQYYFPYKYKNIAAGAQPAEDYMIIRLAEVYLIRSEARARLGNSAMALEDLNQVRNPGRVGLAVYAGATDQQSVLNAIMHERKTELFCEGGNRWFDLKRTNSSDRVLSQVKPNWQTTDALFPVPLNELLTNPFLTQNPGYSGK